MSRVRSGALTSTTMSTSTPMAARDVDGQILREAAINQQAAIALHRGKNAWRRQARAHRACEVPVVHDDGIAGFQIGRHGAKAASAARRSR